MLRTGVVAIAVALALAVPAAAEAPPTDLVKAGAQQIRITGDWLSAGLGGIWMSYGTVVERIHPQTGKLVKEIKVPQGPCEASVIGFGYLWTATCEKPGIVRIDPKTNRIAGFASLPIPSSFDGEASIGAGAGSLWLMLEGEGCTSCELARIDPKTMKVVRRIPVADGGEAVRYGLGSVWVTNPYKDIVQQVDPRTNRVVASAKVPGNPLFFAVGEGAVWVLSQQDGKVTRIGAKTGAVAARIPAKVVGIGGDMTTGAGWVWARGTGYLLSRIDPKTNKVVERYGPSLGSGAVIVGYGSVWASAHDAGLLFRLPLSKI